MKLIKIPPHLIAIDLDGTLLTDDKTIDAKTRRFLRRLEQYGHIIVIATGRPYRAIMRYYNEIGLHGPIICYNGACITNPSDSHFDSRHFSFPREVVTDIYNFVGRKHIDNVMCETNKKIWLLKDDADLFGFFWSDDMEIIYGDLSETLSENPMTMIIKSIDRNDKTAQILKQAVARHENLRIRFWNRSNFSEIYYEHISKGHAMLDLAKLYGIPNERILAFGDAENDVEMLLMAGTSFAMHNGEDSIKHHADIITKYSNNENGIYDALKRYFRRYNI